MDNLREWDTTGIVKIKVALPYERSKQVAHQILNDKCGHGTWHGFDPKDVDGGKAYHLWCKGISDDHEYTLPTGVITVYSDGFVISQPYGQRNTEGTEPLPSGADGDVPAKNDYSQLAGFVLAGLREAEAAWADTTNVYRPIKPGNLLRWQRIWGRVKDRVPKMNDKELLDWYKGMYRSDPVEIKTLRQIITAGSAGVLDDLTAPP